VPGDRHGVLQLMEVHLSASSERCCDKDTAEPGEKL